LTSGDTFGYSADTVDGVAGIWRRREEDAMGTGEAARRTADKLTEARIRGLRPGAKARKYSDGHGLYLYVSPQGARSFRYGYRHGGRERVLTIGLWPETSLAEAREAHAAARRALAGGADPAAEKRAARLRGAREGAATFGQLAGEFLARQAPSLKPRTLAAVRRNLELHVLPSLGARPAASIRPRDVMALLDAPALAGKADLRHKLRALCGQVFRHGIAAGHEDVLDPTSGLAGALPRRRSVPRAAATAPEAVGRLLADVEGFRGRGNGSVGAALRLLPYVFVRPGELCGAEWAEMDLAGGVWTIPASRMKSGREHRVPLSRQARAMLEAQRALCGGGRWVFPSPRVAGGHVGTASLNFALRALGWGRGEACAHGFRSTASTLLYEMGFSGEWIERQLAHAEGNRVKAAYDRAAHMEGRAAMMQAWADRLDALRAGALAAEEGAA
jgi:integrase